MLKNLLAGLVTALFIIPDALAYAQLAGVNPIYGLYSGMVPTLVASLATGTCLMISTLTSAIALTTRSVLDLSGSHDSHMLFTLTFFAGAFMLVFGLLKFGKVVEFVSNSVMTGFVMGVCFLIFAGQLGHFTGYAVQGNSFIERVYGWITHVGSWDPTTTAVGVFTIALAVGMKRIWFLTHLSKVITLFVVTYGVYVLNLLSVELIRDVAVIPSSFPSPSLPDFHVTMQHLLGALSIALVAMVQGAGVSAATHAKKGISRDFIGQGLGNLSGSFFQSLCTGGSLSLTGVSMEAGANSRLAGIFTALFVTAIVLLAGKLIDFIPIACIAAILCIIAVELFLGLIPDCVLIVRTSLVSGLIMIATFLSALLIPLQWTIFLGALLTFMLYIYTSATKIRLFQLVPTEAGEFLEQPVPKQLPSHALTILDYEGNGFFGEIPAIKEHLPSIEKVQGAVLIFRMRGAEDAHSTFLKWLTSFIETFQKNGNLFLLEGVEPHLMPRLEKAGVMKLLSKDHIFPAEPYLFRELKKAIHIAQVYLDLKGSSAL